jgi:hypothetical protein
LRVCALSVLLTAAACPGGGTGNSEQDQIDNRVAFELFARGEVFAGPTTIVALCSAAVAVEDAYPGIDSDAEWRSVAAYRMETVLFSAADSDLSDALILADDRELPIGTENDRRLFSVVAYDGPSPPALDGQWDCGGVAVEPSTARRAIYTQVASENSLRATYDLTIEEVFDSISELRPDTSQMRATQESLVTPIGLADAIVGPVDWPPPDEQEYVRERAGNL